MTDRLNGNAPAKVPRTAQECCDEGNARLAGIIPYTCKKYQGQFHVRDDVRWVLRDGRCVIEFVG